MKDQSHIDFDGSPYGERSQVSEGQLLQSEMDLIEQWVLLADRLSIPRSLVQLYGLLFMSDRPLDAQYCSKALRISRSSAGQGLRTLKELGAIRSAFELGSRSERFCIEPDLGVLIKNMLEGKILPALDGFFAGSEDIQQSDSSEPKKSIVNERIQKLRRWREKLNDLGAGLC